jgi:hypothetical protein
MGFLSSKRKWSSETNPSYAVFKAFVEKKSSFVAGILGA